MVGNSTCFESAAPGQLAGFGSVMQFDKLQNSGGVFRRLALEQDGKVESLAGNNCRLTVGKTGGYARISKVFFEGTMKVSSSLPLTGSDGIWLAGGDALRFLTWQARSGLFSCYLSGQLSAIKVSGEPVRQVKRLPNRLRTHNWVLFSMRVA